MEETVTRESKEYDKSVAEFNFKLLQNVFTSNVDVIKRKDSDKDCPYCDTEENIKQLVFECILSKQI